MRLGTRTVAAVLFFLAICWPGFDAAAQQPIPTQEGQQPTQPSVSPPQVGPPYPGRFPLPVTPPLAPGSTEEGVGAAQQVRPLRFIDLPQVPSPLSVRTSLTVQEEFTDNAMQTRDHKDSQFRTIISPGIAVRADRPNLDVALLYNPEIFIRENTFSETTVTHDASLRGTLFPTAPFRVSFQEDFLHSFDYREIRDATTRASGGGRFMTNTAGGDVAYVTPNLRTALGYRHVLTEDLESNQLDQTHTVRPSLDYTTTRYGVGVSSEIAKADSESFPPYWSYRGDGRFRWNFTPILNAGVAGFYSRHDSSAAQQDYGLTRGRVEAGYFFGGGGSIDVGGGVDTLTFTDRDTHVRPSLGVTVSQRFNWLTVTARYDQGYQQQYENFGATGLTYGLVAELRLGVAIFRDLTGSVGAVWTQNRFEESTIPGISSGTRDRTWDLDAEVRYSIIRPVFVTLGYTCTIRKSTDRTAEFTENRVRLGLTVTYDLL